MEWMLQVVDEIDDALGAVRHRLLGYDAQIGAAFASGVAVAAWIRMLWTTHG